MRSIAINLVGLVCVLVACAATPIAFLFGIHQWAVVDMELKMAVWSGVKLWLSLLFLIVPGFICLYGVGNE